MFFYLTYFFKKNFSDLNTNVGVALAITAKGRIRLYELLLLARKNKANVHYVDTDSIFYSFYSDATDLNKSFIKPIGVFSGAVFNKNDFDTLKFNFLIITKIIYMIKDFLLIN